MKICAYDGSQVPRLGFVRDNQVYDLADAIPELANRLPVNSTDPLKALLTDGDLWEEVRECLGSQPRGESSLGDVRELPLLPPVRPDKFICIGLNYRSHAEEAGMEIPDTPSLFVKLPNAVVGHRSAVPIPRVSHSIDWEGEVAFVVRRRAYHVDLADALDYVAGYTIVNDVSARDYQFKTSQWILGKTFDGFGPVGPVVATPEEVAEPDAIQLTTRVNDVVQQDAATADLIFGVADLVAFLSTVMTLEPGDIVATGTPSGIGALQKPRRWLTEGDTVTVTVEGVGTLENQFRPAP